MTPRLIDVINKKGFDPTLYDGHLHIPSNFFKYFPLHEKSLRETFIVVADFLEMQGYMRPTFEDATEDGLYWNYKDYSIYADPYCDKENRQIVLNIPIQQEKEKKIENLLDRLRKFTEERDWAQFHNPKDLALAINVEAGELLEQFLWKKPEEANPEKVKEELADILAFSLLLADKYGFDVEKILLEKIEKNAEKYPVDKAKGTAKKYNEL